MVRIEDELGFHDSKCGVQKRGLYKNQDYRSW